MSIIDYSEALAKKVAMMQERVRIWNEILKLELPVETEKKLSKIILIKEEDEKIPLAYR